MIELTPEQRAYKEQTLQQLVSDQTQLEAGLAQEKDPRAARSMQRQLAEVEAHISRLQDELAGNVVFDEPVAEQLFRKAAQALANGKFYLAKRNINKLETIEPFYPGLDRMKREAESQQVSRRTRSIAEGKASHYPGADTLAVAPELASALAPAGEMSAAGVAYSSPADAGESPPWYSYLFQFHIMLSCLVVLLLMCVVFGMAGFTIMQWLVQGGV